jgi:hypothetical protein
VDVQRSGRRVESATVTKWVNYLPPTTPSLVNDKSFEASPFLSTSKNPHTLVPTFLSGGAGGLRRSVGRAWRDWVVRSDLNGDLTKKTRGEMEGGS